MMIDFNRFKCAQDISLYLEALIARQEKIIKELDNLTIGFFDPRKAELKRRKKELKTELEQIGTDITTISEAFVRFTTFDSKTFLPFLTSYLTAKEEVQYTTMKGVEEANIRMSVATHLLTSTNEKYNIITTISNQEKLRKQSTLFGDTDNIDRYLSICKDKKFICVPSKSQYSLLKGTTLRTNYRAYPYLRDVAFDLVDLKLSEPNLSDEERLNRVLQGTRALHLHIPRKK